MSFPFGAVLYVRIKENKATIVRLVLVYGRNTLWASPVIGVRGEGKDGRVFASLEAFLIVISTATALADDKRIFPMNAADFSCFEMQQTIFTSGVVDVFIGQSSYRP